MLGIYVKPRLADTGGLISGMVSTRTEVQSSQQAKEDQSRIWKESHYQACNVAQSHGEDVRSGDRFPEGRRVSRREWMTQGLQKRSTMWLCGAGDTDSIPWNEYTSLWLSSICVFSRLCFLQSRFQNLWRYMTSDVPETCEIPCFNSLCHPPGLVLITCNLMVF